MGFKKMIGENLIRYKKDLKVVFADAEAENLHTVTAKPWQFAFSVYHGDELIEEQNLFPWWDNLDVSPKAAQITRFNYHDYKSRACDNKEAWAKWSRYRDDNSYVKVFHNGLHYDSMINASWARGIGVEPTYEWLLDVIDTNCTVKARKKGIVPDLSSRIAFLAFQFRMSDLVEKGLKSNLTAVGKEHGINVDYETLHDGMNDVHLLEAIFHKEKYVCEF